MEVIHWRTTLRRWLAHWPTVQAGVLQSAPRLLSVRNTRHNRDETNAATSIHLSPGFKTLDCYSTDSSVVRLQFRKSKVASRHGSASASPLRYFGKDSSSRWTHLLRPRSRDNASICHGSNQHFRRQREDRLSQSVSLISNLSAEVPVKSCTLRFSGDEICSHVSLKNACQCQKHLAQSRAFARPQSRG